MESDFPSNSNISKQKVLPAKESPKEKLNQVTTGAVVQRKKPLGKRFSETFSGASTKNVADYVFFDVALPALKELIADIVSQGVERKIFGEARSAGRRTGVRPGAASQLGRVAYQQYSQPSNVLRPTPSRQARATHNFAEILLSTRVEADTVIERLFDVLSQYNVVSVSDLYDLVGVTADHTDLKWGWTDLGGADVRRVRDGYLLDLPRPEPID